MAFYARNDVWVFQSTENGAYYCINCKIIRRLLTDFVCETPEEMLFHLEQHVDQGHKVSEEALRRLKKEITLGGVS